jgi:hypothetical protein
LFFFINFVFGIIHNFYKLTMNNKIKEKNQKNKTFRNIALIKEEETLLIDYLKQKLNLPSRREAILFAVKKAIAELENGK